MKTVVTLLFVILTTSAFAEGYPPPHYQVVDSLGNRLVTNEWTKFYFDWPFHHPNGYTLPNKPGQITWVMARPYEPKRFVGWMSLGGFAAGTIDGYNQGYLQRGWDTWDEVERFTWLTAGPTLWGMALDSKYPDACRWCGGFQGVVGGLSIVHHTGWDPSKEELSLAVGTLVGSYLFGWLCDTYRHKPPRNAYRYIIR